MIFWLDFFKDKSFSWDFKIANFIMRDALRNHLAVNCAVLRDVLGSEELTDVSKRRINKVIKSLSVLMHNEVVSIKVSSKDVEAYLETLEGKSSSNTTKG